MKEDLDSRRLATFRAVVEAGQITLAARRLHLSQPAVTAQIQQLEAAVGKALLERRSRGVVPTEAGRRLLAYAIRVEALLEEAAATIGDRDAATGPLVLAASTTVANHVLPRLLARFAVVEGGATVRLEVGNSAQVLAMVEAGEVPLGLTEGPPSAARARLSPFLPDELVLSLAVDAPREFLRIKRPEDLVDVPMAWREPGSGTREVIERALKKRIGRRPAHPRDLQLGSSEAIKGVIREGMAVGFLSLASIQDELASGRLRIVRLPGLRIQRSFSWVLPGRDLPVMASRFYTFAEREKAGG